MKQVGRIGLVVLLAGGIGGGLRHRTVMYAQTVPTTVHPTWNPNPAPENILQYVLTLDGVAPVTVLASTCTATLCTATVSVPAFGAHVTAVVAQNLLISTDPTSLQSAPAASLPWSLLQRGTAVSGLTVRP